jgi:hypothetical protein
LRDLERREGRGERGEERGERGEGRGERRAIIRITYGFLSGPNKYSGSCFPSPNRNINKSPSLVDTSTSLGIFVPKQQTYSNISALSPCNKLERKKKI